MWGSVEHGVWRGNPSSGSSDVCHNPTKINELQAIYVSSTENPQHSGCYDIIFSPYFDLFVWRHSAENDFGKTLGREHSETNATDDVLALDQRQTLVLPVNNKS